jgi:hypothetical protein
MLKIYSSKVRKQKQYYFLEEMLKSFVHAIDLCLLIKSGGARSRSASRRCCEGLVSNLVSISVRIKRNSSKYTLKKNFVAHLCVTVELFKCLLSLRRLRL